MVEGELMPNPLESLNNAIVSLDFHARAPAVQNPDVQRAIGLLVSHWLEFFVNEYQTSPLTGLDAWAPQLQGYLRWYARAYALVPQSVRAKVPAPSSIDVSYAAVVNAEIERVAEGFRSIGAESQRAIDQALGDQARKLAREMGTEAKRVLDETANKARVAALAIGGFVAGLAVLYVSLRALR